MRLQGLPDNQPELDKPTIFIGLMAAGLLLMTTPGKKRPDVPGLRERRNAAWRGPGSYGSSPFGSQVTHRSR